jgi:hypothetical protein
MRTVGTLPLLKQAQSASMPIFCPALDVRSDYFFRDYVEEKPKGLLNLSFSVPFKEHHEFKRRCPTSLARCPEAIVVDPPAR